MMDSNTPTPPSEPASTRTPAPPHTPLTNYYDKDDQRSRYVLDLFDRTAKHYNTIEMLFLNGGLLYRRMSLKRAGLERGMKVLDVAIGTAAVARGATRIVGPEGAVYGVDPSSGMLVEAKKKFDGPLTRGVAQELPFATATFDFVTMGIALRHVSDLKAAFGEYLRVLRPGGKLWILEGHTPPSGLGHKITEFVWAKLIPGMTLVSTGSRDAKLLMDYYWDTVDQCVPPEGILAALGDVGFENPKYQLVVPGAFCEYTGTKAVASP
jgi:demethylmenaquinone methyltransferase/2-methoxy-6-polyprenyl-1,4-benzoquinol methylase